MSGETDLEMEFQIKVGLLGRATSKEVPWDRGSEFRGQESEVVCDGESTK